MSLSLLDASANRQRFDGFAGLKAIADRSRLALEILLKSFASCRSMAPDHVQPDDRSSEL